MKGLAIICFILLSQPIQAFRDKALGVSPEGLLMGNAYTALAEDEYTLFYNPAVLGRHSGFSFYPINPQFRSVNVLDDPDRFSETGSSATGFADAAFDYPIHLGLDYTPGFKMGYFGFSGLYQNNTNLNLQNQVNPSLDIDHRFDKGFIAGVGLPVLGAGGMGQFSLGASIKYIKRESVFGSYDLTGYTLLDALSAGEIADILNDLGKVNGQGWGFDLGADYISKGAQSTFMMGLSFLDVVTTLQTEENVNDQEVQSQPMQVHFGSAWRGTIGGGFDVTVSADIKNLSEQMEFMRRVHLGAEVGLTEAVSVFAGVNAIDNYSYGLKLNTGFLEVYTGVYTEEIGEQIGQQESNRFLLYLSLLEFNFEP